MQRPCQFPFIWKSVKNYGCTTVDGLGKSWCSTKVVPDSLEHDISDSYYGDCNENNTACFNSQPGIDLKMSPNLGCIRILI